MTLSPDIKQSMDRSVLCWLATVSSDHIPNVSPKEIFNYDEQDYILIANIASPQSVKNIQQNPQVCLSFIDIFVQKGFQIKGTAKIITKRNPEFTATEVILLKMTGGKFPFSSITQIQPTSSKPIIAPRYLLFPETTEEDQIERAKRTYGC